MADTSKYITVTEENFKQEVLESTQPVLVDFWADWCAPCHQIAPLIEELADEFEGQARVAKIDVDANPGLAQTYAIRSIPSLLFFQNSEVVDQVSGTVPKKTLANKLRSLV